MSFEPRQFGEYTLLRRLGAGGMAETFLGVRRGIADFEQYVCIKRILPAYEDDQEFIQLFMQEARVAAKLRHANIVQVIDFGVEQGSHYMSLELIEGADLRTVLKALHQANEQLSPEIVTHIALGIASALDFAHQSSRARETGNQSAIYHRDVSPSNVLLSHNGEVKLTDFGIAKATNQGMVTQSGVIKGKIPYLPPEYVTKGEFDARGDLYALGVLMYEALTGVRPYDGQHEIETLTNANAGKHKLISECVPGLNPALAQAIEKLIAPKPEDRFESAAALIEALDTVPTSPMVPRKLGQLMQRFAPPARSSDKPPVNVALPGQTTHAAPGSSPSARSAAASQLPTRTGTPPGDAPLQTGVVNANVHSLETRTMAAVAQAGEASSEEHLVVQGSLAAQTLAAPDLANDSAPRSGLSLRQQALPPGRTSTEDDAFEERPSMSKFAMAPPPPGLDENLGESNPALIPRSPRIPSLEARAPRKMLTYALYVGGALLVIAGFWFTEEKDTDKPADTVAMIAPKGSAPVNVAPKPTVKPEAPATAAATTIAKETETTAALDTSGASTSEEKSSEKRESSSRTRSSHAERSRKVKKTIQIGTGAARIRIRVEPYGQILLDNKEIGEGPLLLKITPGDHKIGSRCEDNRARVKTYTLNDGENDPIVINCGF